MKERMSFLSAIGQNRGRTVQCSVETREAGKEGRKEGGSEKSVCDVPSISLISFRMLGWGSTQQVTLTGECR